jgi:hypothetical protein
MEGGIASIPLELLLQIIFLLDLGSARSFISALERNPNQLQYLRRARESPLRIFRKLTDHAEEFIAVMAASRCILVGSRALELFAPESCGEFSDWNFSQDYCHGERDLEGRREMFLSYTRRLGVIWGNATLKRDQSDALVCKGTFVRRGHSYKITLTSWMGYASAYEAVADTKFSVDRCFVSGALAAHMYGGDAFTRTMRVWETSVDHCTEIEMQSSRESCSVCMAFGFLEQVRHPLRSEEVRELYRCFWELVKSGKTQGEARQALLHDLCIRLFGSADPVAMDGTRSFAQHMLDRHSCRDFKTTRERINEYIGRGYVRSSEAVDARNFPSIRSFSDSRSVVVRFDTVLEGCTRSDVEKELGVLSRVFSVDDLKTTFSAKHIELRRSAHDIATPPPKISRRARAALRLRALLRRA